jgi:hypothetical protein
MAGPSSSVNNIASISRYLKMIFIKSYPELSF